MEVEPLAEREIDYTESQDDSFTIPKYNIFNRYYHNLSQNIVNEFHVERSYEHCLNYYLVFAPLINHKDSPKDMMSIEKYLRDKYKYERIIITREIRALRTHYNVVITTKNNPLELNGRIVKTFYIDVQHIPNKDDIKKVIYYAIKESKQREYTHDDYFIYLRSK